MTLLPEDALRFKQLTTTNISRHVMLAVGDVPVAAPRVLAPIENGRFVIPCETKEEVQTLEKVLQGLAGGR